MEFFHFLFYLSFLLGLFVQDILSISVLNGSTCAIQPQSTECKNEPKCCSYIQQTPGLLTNSILSVMSFVGKKCNCMEKCKKRKIVCQHGKCDQNNNRCVCQPCYSGDTCNIYENEHAPKFTATESTITIRHDIELNKRFHKISATDKDAKLCHIKTDCKCGTIIYKLLTHNDLFHLQANSGELMLKRRPDLPKYVLKISAQNDGDDIKKSYLQLKVVITSSMSNEIVHHRKRRAIVIPDSTDTFLHIEAIPILEDTYYFNKGDDIKFLIRAKHNKTGGTDVDFMNIHITSTYLQLHSPSKDAFETAAPNGTNAFIFSTTSSTPLRDGESMSGTINATVKNNIGPLTSLYLDMSASYGSGGGEYGIKDVKSSPTVYAVFPVVTVNRTIEGPIEVTNKLPMSFFIEAPLLNYTLYVEITTGIEDFIFMSIENVDFKKGNALSFNGSNSFDSYSTQQNSEFDRVSADFGYLSVLDNSPITERFMNITFDVRINDHPLVYHDNTYSFGVGLQAGPRILWVEQQDLKVIKNEPALELEVSSYMISNFTRVFIGDTFNITANIRHANSSRKNASDLMLTFTVSEQLVLNWPAIVQTGTSVDKSFPILPLSDEINFVFTVTIKDNITPLQRLNMNFTLNYKNALTRLEKRPVLFSYEKLVVGAPIISLTFDAGQSQYMVPGNRRTVFLTILLTRMRAPLVVEIISPKANNQSYFTILTMKVKFIGSNIQGLGAIDSYTATLKSTTSDSYVKDQAILDLGTAVNSNDGDTADNRIILEVDVLLIENDNLTISNATEVKFGAGVVSAPKMVWVGQLSTYPHILSTEEPRLNVNYTGELNGDIYTLDVSIAHAQDSNMIAYNVTFQYYLPPFVEFVSEISSPPDVQKDGADTILKYAPKFLFFTESFKHSIQVRVVPKKSSKTGENIEYLIPLRVSYSNRRTKRKNTWKSIKNTMNVVRRDPIIPKSSEAKEHYYGRGFYYQTSTKTIYVCSNQHTPTYCLGIAQLILRDYLTKSTTHDLGTTRSRPACYSSTDGINFRRIDGRVGCIIGHHPATNELYGVARNQKTYLKYKPDKREWYLVPDASFEAQKTLWPDMNKDFRNIETASTFEVPGSPENVHKISISGDKEWIGTGHGLYHRMDGSSDYILSAKWIRYKQQKEIVV